jgi:hypothetical protein
MMYFPIEHLELFRLRGTLRDGHVENTIQPHRSRIRGLLVVLGLDLPLIVLFFFELWIKGSSSKPLVSRPRNGIPVDYNRKNGISLTYFLFNGL